MIIYPWLRGQTPEASLLDSLVPFRSRSERMGALAAFCGNFKCSNHRLLSIPTSKKIEAWRLDYNGRRPHSSLEVVTPEEFLQKWRRLEPQNGLHPGFGLDSGYRSTPPYFTYLRRNSLLDRPSTVHVCFCYIRRGSVDQKLTLLLCTWLSFPTEKPTMSHRKMKLM